MRAESFTRGLPRMRHWLHLLAAAAMLAACAAPEQPRQYSVPDDKGAAHTVEASAEEIRQLQELVSARRRLYRMGAPLLAANADLCRRHARPLLGFRAQNSYSFPEPLRNAAQVALRVGERLQVSDVLPGSGAEQAGIRPGDVLLKVGTQPFPGGEHADREAAALLLPLIEKQSSLQLTMLRGERELQLDVPLTRACAFNIEFGNSPNVNAYGDGYRILLTRGMLDAVRRDEELAYVIAREMAHNILGHAARMNQQATVGGIIDNLVQLRPDLSSMTGMAGLRPIAPEYDTAADKLSVYLLARAGYDLEPVVPFWKDLAERYPASVRNAYTALHPATARRLEALEDAVRDVDARRKDGRPLLPMP